MEWISDITTTFFIALGAMVMLFSIVSTRHIMLLLKEENYVQFWQILLLLMIFFFFGYIGVVLLIFMGMDELLLLLTGLVFFFGALFVYLVVHVGRLTIVDLKQEISERKQMEQELNTYQEHLEKQVRDRTKDLEKANTQMQENLNLAAEFQQAILPVIDDIEFLKISRRYFPHSKVSGDVYDMSINREKEFCFFLGDATGHGVSAAFLTMMLEIGLETIPSHLSSDEVLRRLNRLLASRETGKSITGIYFRINPEGKLRLSNAGHPSLVVIPHDGTSLVIFQEGGLPLGMFSEELVALVEETYQLQHGDKVFAYTDGIIEWQNPTGQQYGIERLLRFLEKNRFSDVNTILDNLLSNLHQFSADVPCGDDVTMHCFQFQKKMVA